MRDFSYYFTSADVPSYVDLTDNSPDPWKGNHMDREKIQAVAEEIRRDPYGVNDRVYVTDYMDRNTTCRLNLWSTGKHHITGWHGGLALFTAQLFAPADTFDWDANFGTAALEAIKGHQYWAQQVLRLSNYQNSRLMVWGNWPVEFKHGAAYYLQHGPLDQAANIVYRRIQYFLCTDEHKEPKSGVGRRSRSHKSKPIDFKAAAAGGRS